VETIGSKRSYALTWCMPNNDDDDIVCWWSISGFLLIYNFRYKNTCSVLADKLRLVF